jgi:hypothetical protein
VGSYWFRAAAPFIPILLLLKFFYPPTLLCALAAAAAADHPLARIIIRRPPTKRAAGVEQKISLLDPEKEGYDPISIIKEAAAHA